MKRFSKKSLLLLLLISLLAFPFIGCSKPPTKEIENAEKAIAEAKQKEADLYAETLFAKASETLKKAKEMVAAKNYKDAKNLADQALVEAQQSIQAIETNRAKMKSDTEQLIIAIQNAMNEVKTSVTDAIRKKIQINQQEIQATIGKWEIDLLTAKENLTAGKIRQAFDQLKSLDEQVKNQKENLKNLLEVKSGKK
ncbi:MAG: DUF4398 domain-containing protein [Thermodesulfovibrionales bacterium]|nr:DUF4398 domain-containing protein [Thermodesulfovibrionales bacterium]